MARLTGLAWVYELPWILLRIRTAPKEDLGTSSAELVFGSPLTAPGDFIPCFDRNNRVAEHLQQFRDIVKDFAPIPTSAHCTPQVAVPNNLGKSKFVFVRVDKHHGPL